MLNVIKLANYILLFKATTDFGKARIKPKTSLFIRSLLVSVVASIEQENLNLMTLTAYRITENWHLTLPKLKLLQNRATNKLPQNRITGNQLQPSLWNRIKPLQKSQ